MKEQTFSQEEVNRIIALRVKRERERLTKEFEYRLKRLMASVHLTLHGELCAMKQHAKEEGGGKL